MFACWLSVPVTSRGPSTTPRMFAAHVRRSLDVPEQADDLRLPLLERNLGDRAELDPARDAAGVRALRRHPAIGIERVQRQALLPQAGEAYRERIVRARA